ncbi:MAG: hypothetical protein V8T90_02305 [Victivallales bacterium]
MEEAQVLKRGIMRSVSVKARPMLTPLLSRMVGNLDTVDDLEKKIANVKEIVERILGVNGKNKLWVQVASTDILALRKALRLSQAKFGRLTDATRFSVSNWEHAKTIPHPYQRECIFEIAEHSLANLEHIRKKYRS